MPLKSCYGQDSEELFTTAADNWRLEGWLAQFGWIGALAHDGWPYFSEVADRFSLR